MTLPDDAPPPEPTIAEAPPAAPIVEPAPAVPTVPPPRTGRLTAWALAAGLVAAASSWLIGEATYDRYPPQLFKTDYQGLVQMSPTSASLDVAQAKNATFAYGILGATLGLALGVAGGLARRSALAAAGAGLLGALLGIAAGAGSMVGLTATYLHRDPTKVHELTLPILMHAASWGAVGAVCGLALGLGFDRAGRAWRAAVGGLIGALLGTAAYELIGAIAFAGSNTDQPLSTTWATRLLARTAVCLGVALFAAQVAGAPVARRSKAPVSAAS